MKKLIKAIIWTLVIGGLSYLAYTQLEKNKAKIEEEAKMTLKSNAAIPVVTAQVGKTSWNGKHEVIGTFSPNKQVNVMSEAAGKVVSLNFKNGDFVNAGATLLTTDSDLLKIQLKTVQTNLKKAQSDFKRLNNLLNEGGVTQQQIDDAKLSIDNLEIQIESIEKQISMTLVKAPISGIVSNKMVELGSLVAPSMSLGQITNIDKLKLQVFLTEEQVVSIRKGQSVPVKADILPEKTFNGTVSFIDVNASTSKRYLVEIEIPNNNKELKAGMTGTAYFEGSQYNELLSVPRKSIVGNLQDAKIYVVENEKAVLKSVETGVFFGDMVQIKKGLEVGETIILSGQINLEDGASVSISTNK